MSVRSTRLFGPTLVPLAGPATPIFTCPPGRTARCLSIRVAGGGAATITGAFYVNGSAVMFWRVVQPGSTLDTGLLVLIPGDVLAIDSSAVVASTLYASGYGSLLLGAPT